LLVFSMKGGNKLLKKECGCKRC